MVAGTVASSAPRLLSHLLDSQSTPAGMKNTKETLIELKELIENMIERADTEENAAPVAAVTAPVISPPPTPATGADSGKGRLAIVVGHTKIAPGAFATAPLSASEYPWNSHLAGMIKSAAEAEGHACELFFRDRVGVEGAYEKAEEWDPDAVMELHFNAANGQARGTETLRGIQPEASEWAECVHDAMLSLYDRSGKADRGIKKLRPGDRGHQSVSQLENVPSVLIEPFFGDAAEDARLGQEKKDALGKALAAAFIRFMDSDSMPGRPGGQAPDASVAAAARLTPELRLRMGKQIVKFEGRRDSAGKLAVYKLPRGDGGGTYEVAGINDRYHPEKVRELRDLIAAGEHQKAEDEAAEYIMRYTDRVDPWVSVPGVEFYLRDSAFNRGAGGAAKILQLALGVTADGKVGPNTLTALKAEETKPPFLQKLRDAREEYEVRYIGKRPQFWAGLTNRWNNALAFAKTL